MKSIFCYHDDGRLVDALNFTLSDFTVPGLARTFARINRFSGNGVELETVSDAQHQVNLSYLVPPGLEKAALIHEIPEIFMGDIPYPVKSVIPEVDALEERILRRAAEVFKVPYHQFLEIGPFDTALARDEARFLFPGKDHNPDLGLGIEVMGMSMERAASEWMRRFYELFGGELSI